MRGRLRITVVVLAACVFAHPGCTSEDILLVTLPDGGLSVDSDIEPREEGMRCERDTDCPSDAFCARRSCAGRDGRCERRPTFCDGTPAPVCGCDGVTYWNDCLRKARGHTSAIPGECALGSAKGCDRGTKCAPGAVCTRIVPAPEACAPDVPGVCWVVPAACPPASGVDRFVACGPPGGEPPCVDLCQAARSGMPHARATTCP
jgi:hypothetical protein